jgi:predicted nucleic acid-binding protein
MAEQSVVLDTNVFVAAGFNPHSASAQIIESVRAGHLRLVWNETTRSETESVLRQIPPLDWRSFADLFRPEDRSAITVPLERFPHIPDWADRKFAALSKSTGAVLVTADDHLLGTRDRGAIQIMTPDEFWTRYG